MLLSVNLLNLDYIIFGKFIEWNSKYLPYILTVISTKDLNEVYTAFIDLKSEFYKSRRIRQLYKKRKPFVCENSSIEYIKLNELRVFFQKFVKDNDEGFWSTIFGTLSQRQKQFFEHYLPRVENCGKNKEKHDCSCIKCITKFNCKQYIENKNMTVWNLD